MSEQVKRRSTLTNDGEIIMALAESRERWRKVAWTCAWIAVSEALLVATLVAIYWWAT